MKKLFITIFICFNFFSCAVTPTPKGALYTNTKGPLLITNNEVITKKGSASVICYFLLYSTGNVSIAEIAVQERITRIHHVDYHDFSIFFGLYQKYTVTVYGD